MSARHHVEVGRLAVWKYNAYPAAKLPMFRKIGFLPGVYYTEITGLMSDFEPVLGSKITGWYESGGGELHDDLWQFTEDGGLG